MSLRRGKKTSAVVQLTAAMAVACSIQSVASAAEEKAEEYTLDQVVVTAQRKETKELDTPATTTVITAKDLKEKGAISAYDAMEHVIGVNSYSYGSGGEDYGGMYSRINIRGLDKGTLVLVNGVSVNLMNYNTMMSSIPVDAIERIEIVKGSNAALYGAEAMGGVINIITKKPSGKPGGSVTTTYGNYNKDYSFAVNDDKFELFYKKEYRGSIDQYNRLYTTGTTKIAKGNGTKDSIFFAYNISDDLTFNYAYADTNSHFLQYKYNNKTKDWTTLYKNYYYYDNRQNANLIYNNKESGVKSTMAYNKNNFRPGADATTNTDLSNYNFDNQKTWRFRNGKDSLVGGFTLQSEHYTQHYGAHQGDFDRDSYALYTSYSRQMADKFTTVLGLRGHFVKENEYDAAQNIFLPQLQTLYKINDHASWYTNIGKSFEMPASNSLFVGSTSTIVKLKPQEGWNYETGLKFIHNDESFKVALFSMDIKNKFKWVYENTVIPGGSSTQSVQINQDKFRNSGIEMEYNRKINDNWKYNLGASFSNPEAKSGEGAWTQADAKLQLSTGATYTKNKLTANMDLFVTGKREMTYYNLNGVAASKTYADHRIPDNINLNLTFQYAVNHNDTVTLAGYNLLDRDNPVNYTEYWSTPLNYQLSYNHKF